MAVIFGNTGTEGNDTLDPRGNASQTINGKAGTDSLVIHDNRNNFMFYTLNGVTVLFDVTSTNADYDNDVYTIINTEFIVFDDETITLTSNSRALIANTGTSGSDVLYTQGVAGTIDGGAGNDTFLFFDSIDNFDISYLAGIITVTARSSASVYPIDYRNDIYTLINVESIRFLDDTYTVPGTGGGGGVPGEFIFGETTDDTLSGTDGDDTIDPGGGSDEIDGAGGVDIVLLPDVSSHFRVTTLAGVTRLIALNDAPADYAGGESRLINVEQLQFRNTTVNLQTTSLDVLLGTAGTETDLAGSDGDDVIDHGGGADRIDGGNGFDTVLFFDSVSNYRMTTVNGITRVLGLGDADRIRAALPYAGFEVILTNVESVQFRDRRVTTCGGNDDQIQTWAGKDVVDGGAGIDTAFFEGTRSAYSIARTATGFTVNGAGTDQNTLQNVERFAFADQTLGFDLQPSTPLYNTVLMGAAAAGRGFIENPVLLGGGLRFAQAYADMQQLAEAVVDLGIYDGMSDRAFVQFLFQNVQHAPAPGEAELYEWALDFGFDRSQVLRVFAESGYNAESVNLIGLQQSGIEFI